MNGDDVCVQKTRCKHYKNSWVVELSLSRPFYTIRFVPTSTTRLSHVIGDTRTANSSSNSNTSC